jgi:beta-galactosidase GanA
MYVSYVFWNYHEDVKGTKDYETESRNLREFLQAAQDAGLFVNLRIGPYGQCHCGVPSRCILLSRCSSH